MKEKARASGWHGFSWMFLRSSPACAAIARRAGLGGRVPRARSRLSETVEQTSWDGEWYRRAYFDDGTPLGSQQNEEACIDSLPQSWSVISGAGNPDRAAQAMRSVEEHLIRDEEKLVLFFTPPFDIHAASRLHHGISAWCARERRPIHTRRSLGCDGIRPNGRGRSCSGGPADAESDRACTHSGGLRAYIERSLTP